MRFLEFLEPIIAYGDSLSTEQHLARLTRKSQPSVASNYQAGFYSQGIKKPAYTPPAFDGLYFLRMYPSCLLWFWWIVKLGWCFKAYTIPCAFFGVLRTYYRLWRFAKCLTALSEVNPEKPRFSCKQLSGWFYSQGIKRPAYTPPAFDGLYFLRMHPSCLLWFLMDCKIGVMFQSLYYSLCIFWSS